MTIPDAVELTEIIIKEETETERLYDFDIDALNLLVTLAKKTFLLQIGWREVPGDNDATEWLAPVSFTGKPHYFDLETAYALETDGEGIIAYSTQELTTERLRAADIAFMDALEPSDVEV